jgi:hypothetical protein
MSNEVLGSSTFLVTPTVNGADVLLNAGGVPAILSDTTANRPAAGSTGRLFLDTTLNAFYRDNGASWDAIVAAASVSGTTNQINVAGGVVSIADNAVLPGTGAFRPPVGTTAQRPGAPTAGDTRWNTTTAESEEFNGTFWKPKGVVLQMVSGSIAASTGTSQTPLDNTVPTSTEGTQIWTQSFTPLSTTSKIMIMFNLVHSNSSNANTNILAVFAGTTNIGASIGRVSANNGAGSMGLCITYTPGSTAAITFSGRLGSTGGTWYVNQTSAATLGGSLATEYTITEYA